MTKRLKAGHVASDLPRGKVSPALVVGGGLAGLVIVAGAVIMAQMSGCCGGAPTHGCKFIEVSDAAMDSAMDAMLPCGFEICVPGQTTCCLEARSEPPLKCIPLTAVCQGQSANCSGDQDCPVGSGQHCCGTIATMTIRCQADCPPDFSHGGGTARVCRTNQECPSDFPTCGAITISSQTLYVCLPMSPAQ
jgi:hypothetical protein